MRDGRVEAKSVEIGWKVEYIKKKKKKGEILTEEGEVGGRVTDELDERFPHGLADHAVGSDDVRDAEERK